LPNVLCQSDDPSAGTAYPLQIFGLVVRCLDSKLRIILAYLLTRSRSFRKRSANNKYNPSVVYLTPALTMRSGSGTVWPFVISYPEDYGVMTVSKRKELLRNHH